MKMAKTLDSLAVAVMVVAAADIMVAVVAAEEALVAVAVVEARVPEKDFPKIGPALVATSRIFPKESFAMIAVPRGPLLRVMDPFAALANKSSAERGRIAPTDHALP